jgi:hypothetical protein
MDKNLESAVIKPIISLYQKENVVKTAAKGLYEVWFTMIDDLENQTSNWIRYTLLVRQTDLKGTKGKPIDDIIDSISGGTAILWFANANAKDPSQNYMIKKIFPLSKAIGSKRTADGKYSVIKIDAAEITLDGMKGGFETKGGKKVAWDLTFSHYMEPYKAVPNIARIFKITKNVWETVHPNLRMNGNITIDGKSRVIKDFPGAQTHTYGPSYSYEFVWGHCNTFKDTPEAFFDLGAKATKASLAFFDGTTQYFFNKASTIKLIKVEKSLTLIKIRGGNKLIDLEGEITVPKELLIGVEYSGPEGSKLYCYNTEVADFKLKVIIKNPDGSIKEEKEFLAEKSFALETNWLAPQEDIKFLSWGREEL